MLRAPSPSERWARRRKLFSMRTRGVILSGFGPWAMAMPKARPGRQRANRLAVTCCSNWSNWSNILIRVSLQGSVTWVFQPEYCPPCIRALGGAEQQSMQAFRHMWQTLTANAYCTPLSAPYVLAIQIPRGNWLAIDSTVTIQSFSPKEQRAETAPILTTQCVLLILVRLKSGQ